MSDQIHVRSPERLKDVPSLIEGLRRLSSRYVEIASTDMAEKLLFVSRRGEQIRYELEEAQRDLENAMDSSGDDEDGGDCSQELKRVEAINRKLRRFQEAEAKIKSEVAAFRSELRDFERQLGQRCRSGLELFANKFQALGAYHAIEPEAQNASSSHATQAPSAATSQPPSHSQLVEDLSPAAIGIKRLRDLRGTLSKEGLPSGFYWVDLERVADKDLITDENEFGDVSKAKMSTGISSFHNDLVPILSENPDVSVEALRELDRERGTDFDDRGHVHPQSLETLWRVFVNPVRHADVIAIGSVAEDGTYEITSGRHRLGVAKELGYRFMPARILVSD